MISAIMNKFGYVRKSEAVSLSDYMRLRKFAEELLASYNDFKKTVSNAEKDANYYTLGSLPSNVFQMSDHKRKNQP